MNPNPPVRLPVVVFVVVVAFAFVDDGLGSLDRLKMFVNSARIFSFTLPSRFSLKSLPNEKFSAGWR
jgi:hypothetical protein